MASSGGEREEKRGRRRRHIDRFVPFDLRQVGGERRRGNEQAGRRAIIRNSKEIGGGGGDVCEEGDPVRPTTVSLSPPHFKSVHNSGLL